MYEPHNKRQTWHTYARRFTRALDTFSFFEKVLFSIFFVLLVTSSALLLRQAHFIITEPHPSTHGAFKEAVLEEPRFINPVFASRDVDQSITRLVFQGLMRRDQYGRLVPDLTQSYTVSPDKKTYTFSLHPGSTFHDGNAITSADVAFTIETILNPDTKSPHALKFQGVHVATIDASTVVITLDEVYPNFLETLTIGILPSHMWQNTPPRDLLFVSQNRTPIGSGPYKVQSIKQDSEGVIERIVVRKNATYTHGMPYIQKRVFVLAPNAETALQWFTEKQVDAVSDLPHYLANDLPEKTPGEIYAYTLPRVFGIFLNPERTHFSRNTQVTEAIAHALHPEILSAELSSKYLKPHTYALPSLWVSLPEPERISDEDIHKLLDEAGYVVNEQTQERTNTQGQSLSFVLSTPDSEEIIQLARVIQKRLADFQIVVTIEPLTFSADLSPTIRTRDFEALLFGYQFSHDTDMFAYWHSSWRSDPGLNITGYANTSVDALLEKASQTTQQSERIHYYKQVATTLAEERPAIFLLEPQFLYLAQELHGLYSQEHMHVPADRFNDAHNHHVDTYRRLVLFSKAR